LIRIVDPAGDAIAWLDPSGGTCAGFAVRQWTGDVPSKAFRHLVVGIQPDVDESPSGIPPRDIEPRWRFVERDPASCTLEREPDIDEPDGLVSMTASLDDGELSLTYRLLSPPSPSTVPVRLGCTSRPSIRKLSPGHARGDDGSANAVEGNPVVTHGSGFIAAPIRMVTAPDGMCRYVVELAFVPEPAIADPGDSPAYIVQIGARATQPI